MSDKMMVKDIMDNLKLVCTCSSYPEQYDVFFNDRKVGYIRLRFGFLTVNYPDEYGRMIFQKEFDDDMKGSFDAEEAEEYLEKCKLAIVYAMVLESVGLEIGTLNVR